MSTEKKSFSPKVSRKRKRTGGTPVPRNFPYNEMLLKTAWSHFALTSNGSGVLGDFIGPTITNTNEYSTIASLFTEVKLMACEIHLISRNPYSTGTTSSTITLGTDMGINNATAVAPTTIDNVINSSNVKDFASTNPRPVTYVMSVPKSLEFSAIAADAPNPVTPWAGSPGAVLIFGTGMANTTAYFDVRVYATYHLRGRN